MGWFIVLLIFAVSWVVFLAFHVLSIWRTAEQTRESATAGDLWSAVFQVIPFVVAWVVAAGCIWNLFSGWMLWTPALFLVNSALFAIIAVARMIDMIRHGAIALIIDVMALFALATTGVVAALSGVI